MPRNPKRGEKRRHSPRCDPAAGLDDDHATVVYDTLHSLGFRPHDDDADPDERELGWGNDARWVSEQLQYYEEWLRGVRRIALDSWEDE